jgi:hypothetical protein
MTPGHPRVALSHALNSGQSPLKNAGRYTSRTLECAQEPVLKKGIVVRDQRIPLLGCDAGDAAQDLGFDGNTLRAVGDTWGRSTSLPREGRARSLRQRADFMGSLPRLSISRWGCHSAGSKPPELMNARFTGPTPDCHRGETDGITYRRT